MRFANGALRRKLARTADLALGETQRAARSLLTVKHPDDGQTTTAKKLDVGLIVMGTHGRRGLPRAILGSVAERVVRLSPVPVLTVRGADRKEREASAPQ
jgi:nucleotide-binding universal stress UspA family protein